MYMFAIQKNNMYVPHGVRIPNGAALGNISGVDWYCLSLHRNKYGFLTVYIYDKISGRYFKSVRKDKLTGTILSMAKKENVQRLTIDWESVQMEKKKKEEKIKKREMMQKFNLINSVMIENLNDAKSVKKGCKSMRRVAAMYEKRGHNVPIVYHATVETF